MILDLPAAPVGGDATTQSEWRHAVRRALLGWRAGLDAQTHQKVSDQIRGHFATFLKDRTAATIGFYWPIQNEIDLRPVVTAHVKSGGKAALPVVPGKDQAMIFHDWTPDTEMVPGFARIPEPVESKMVPVHVMVAPLVGFDDRGYRLGYGGGFFDRTLAAMKVRPLVVGVGFAATRLADILPHEYDIPVDIILTEAGMSPVTEKATGELNRAEGSSPPCFRSS